MFNCCVAGSRRSFSDKENPPTYNPLHKYLAEDTYDAQQSPSFSSLAVNMSSPTRLNDVRTPRSPLKRAKQYDPYRGYRPSQRPVTLRSIVEQPPPYNPIIMPVLPMRSYPPVPHNPLQRRSGGGGGGSGVFRLPSPPSHEPLLPPEYTPATGSPPPRLSAASDRYSDVLMATAARRSQQQQRWPDVPRLVVPKFTNTVEHIALRASYWLKLRIAVKLL